MQEQQKGFSERDSFNLLFAVAMGQATCITAFSRINFGSEALGVPGLMAAVVFWFWILATHSADLMQLGVFWLGALVLHRLHGLHRQRRGEIVHSKYNGYPFLTGCICKDERLAKGLEGLLAMAFGFVIDQVDWACGHFLMASGGAIIFIEVMFGEMQRKRVRALQDAQIEMEALVHEGMGRVNGRGRR